MTAGWEPAVRGMRNPLNSWARSDSSWDGGEYHIGKNDLALMQKLAAAGNDHGKFLRMITVICDISAPLYWWKEMDTYKVGTVANSCSTMHKIAAKEFTRDDFSCEHLADDEECLIELPGKDTYATVGGVLGLTINALNTCRTLYNQTGNKKYWYQMIQLLPSSYNQRRTWAANYAVLRNICHARKDHKLDEWHTFCHWITELPYAKELIIE